MDPSERKYTIYVCGNCGSDNIEASTMNDSLCGDCGQWMNCEAVEVAATARGAVDAERELLHEVATAGVEHDDERIGYVTVQINRVTWSELQARRATDTLGRP